MRNITVSNVLHASSINGGKNVSILFAQQHIQSDSSTKLKERTELKSKLDTSISIQINSIIPFISDSSSPPTSGHSVSSARQPCPGVHWGLHLHPWQESGTP